MLLSARDSPPRAPSLTLATKITREDHATLLLPSISAAIAATDLTSPSKWVRDAVSLLLEHQDAGCIKQPCGSAEFRLSANLTCSARESWPHSLPADGMIENSCLSAKCFQRLSTFSLVREKPRGWCRLNEILFARFPLKASKYLCQ